VIAITKFQFFIRDRSKKKYLRYLKKTAQPQNGLSGLLFFGLRLRFSKKNSQFARAKMG
jgi:hypothetical protein